MSTTTLDAVPDGVESPDPREERKARKDAAARALRAEMIANADPATLAELGIPLDRASTRREVAQMFDVKPNSTLAKVIERNTVELEAAGYDRDTGDFSTAATLLVGLLLRPVTSALAARVQQLLDPACRASQVYGASSDHTRAMQAALATATELIGMTNLSGPDEVWSILRDLDEYAVRAVAVVLLHGASAEGGRLAKIKAFDPNRRTHPLGGSAAAGLAQVVPSRPTWRGSGAAERLTVAQITRYGR